MLNIPSAIKTLYQTDGTHKNVRIHFPNGEFPDITNDNLVRESLHFTESLCSQDTFRFGLAEASVLEIETVGIGNMYGMTIEASIEIDGSSLSAADKASIAAGTWDGTWDGVEETFSIPLGSFKVDSCPRDHQNMAHRKVTAYTTYTGRVSNSPFEVSKLATVINGASGNYEADAAKIVYAAFGWDNQSMRDALTKSVYLPWSQLPNLQQETEYIFSTSNTHYVSVFKTGRRPQFSAADCPPDSFYGLELGAPVVTSEASTWVHDTMVSMGGFTDEEIAQALAKLEQVLHPHLVNIRTGILTSSQTANGYFSGDLPIFYPKYADATSVLALEVVTQVNIEIRHGGNTQSKSGVTVINATPTFYQYTDSIVPIMSSFQPTGVSGTSSTYIGCYDFLEILAGYTGLKGQFGRVDRLGGFKVTTLDPSTPMSVTPTDYSECWWDEYDVSPIGTVTVTYKDNDAAEMTADIEIGSGASRYDMTDNETLRALSSADLTTVEGIITGDFATNAANIGFTPIDLQMQGWPWLEAGDALEITAEDGTTVDTYALRVEMSGIQNLQMAITAQGGQIIGEA